MNVQITAIYTALTALLMLVLAYRVVRFRRSMKVGVGDKGDRAFSVAIRAHANLVEYAPMTLLLLLLAELNAAPALFVHACGGAFVLLRLAHAWGFTQSVGGASPFRFVGILGNWILIVLLSLYHLFQYLL